MLGLSVDSVPCLKAWADSLGGITYPLLSDFFPHGAISQRYGVLRAEGYSERAIFVVDKQGLIRYVDVHPIDDQPDNEVLFRVLAEIEPRAASAVPAQPVAQPAPPPRPQADVVLYCTPWCPDCRRVRNFLREHQIDFIEIDITSEGDIDLKDLENKVSDPRYSSRFKIGSFSAASNVAVFRGAARLSPYLIHRAPSHFIANLSMSRPLKSWR